MQCALFVFMLLYATHHVRSVSSSSGVDEVSAQHGRQPGQAKISMHSSSPQISSMAMAINTFSQLMLVVEYNGAVLVSGRPLLVENERVKRCLSRRDFWKRLEEA